MGGGIDPRPLSAPRRATCLRSAREEEQKRTVSDSRDGKGATSAMNTHISAGWNLFSAQRGVTQNSSSCCRTSSCARMKLGLPRLGSPSPAFLTWPAPAPPSGGLIHHFTLAEITGSQHLFDIWTPQRLSCSAQRVWEPAQLNYPACHCRSVDVGSPVCRTETVRKICWISRC